MRETWVPSLSWEEPLEKRKATHSGLGEFHGLHSPWGRKEPDTTEGLSLHFMQTPVQMLRATASEQDRRVLALNGAYILVGENNRVYS